MDPFGIDIMLTYAVGSVSQAFLGEQPHIPALKWYLLQD